MCPEGGKVFTIDKRLIDLITRRGAYENTQYHIKETYKLKEYFDNLLGYNLFPKIICKNIGSQTEERNVCLEIIFLLR